MQVCVFGAGATGGHFAASLARAGVDVSVVVRGANLQAIRSHGLRLRADAGEFTARVRASDDAALLGPQDVVLLTLKSHALPGTAAQVAQLLGPRTAVVFLQNGIPWWYFHGHGGRDEGRRLPHIDPGDAVWNAVGPQRAIGGITSSACTLSAPGLVEVRGVNQPVVLGEPDGSDTARLRSIAELFRAAGFPVEVSATIRNAIWSKLSLNLGSGPLAVLAPVPLNAMFANATMVATRLRIQAEVAAIAAAMGCEVQGDPGAQLALVQRSPHVPSIGQDAAAGRRLELETMFLAPLRMARELGIATPTLDLLVELCVLKARASGLYS